MKRGKIKEEKGEATRSERQENFVLSFGPCGCCYLDSLSWKGKENGPFFVSQV